MTPNITVKKSGPGFLPVQKAIKELRQAEVLVGIPADKTPRKGDVITNASLLYIHTHGSQLQNIPARPVVEPAIEGARSMINPELAKAAAAIVDNDPKAAERALNRAGTIASNAAKRRFGSAELAPNAPSTIRRKKSSAPLIDTAALRRAVTYVVRLRGTIPS